MKAGVLILTALIFLLILCLGVSVNKESFSYRFGTPTKKFIFIPVVNNFHLLEQAIASVPPGIFDEYLIFNNTDDGEIPIDTKHFRVINHGRKTFLQTQNIMRNYAIDNGYDYFCFMHNDGEAVGDVVKRLVDLADNTTENWGLIFTEYDVLCAFRTRAVQDIGPWGDETWPTEQVNGYYLDNDYYRRLEKKYKHLYLEQTDKSKVLHNEFSNTIRSGKEKENHQKVIKLVQNHYLKKWGGLPGSEKN